MNLGAILNSEGVYTSDTIMVNRSGEPFCSDGSILMPDMDCHRSVYSMQEDMLPRVLIREEMTGTWAVGSSLALNCDPESMVEHQSQCTIPSSVFMEVVQLQGLPMFDSSPVGSFGARLRPKRYPRTCSMAHIVDFESILLREAESYHLGMKLGLHGVFRMLGWPNMVMVHRIRHIGLHMVEPREVRLPDEQHACWKKRHQKGVGVMSDPIYGSSYWVFNHPI